jgi:hypothetical protein
VPFFLPATDMIGKDFKSKKLRVNLNLPIKAQAETKAESTDVLKTVFYKTLLMVPE